MSVVGLHALPLDRRLYKIKAVSQGVLPQINDMFASTFWTGVYPSIMDADFFRLTIGLAFYFGVGQGDGLIWQCAWRDGFSPRGMIAVEGNPLVDVGALDAVKMVMKGGRFMRSDDELPAA